MVKLHLHFSPLIMSHTCSVLTRAVDSVDVGHSLQFRKVPEKGKGMQVGKLAVAKGFNR